MWWSSTFLNQRNAADQRVLELLQDKFHLFDGVFGASDQVLGQIESGMDFEKRIAEIYDRCRTPADIDAAFAQLRTELDADIQARMQETEKLLLEHLTPTSTTCCAARKSAPKASSTA
jgi:hypothetical protein